MNLKSQLENKLQDIKQKLLRAQEVYDSCSTLIRLFFARELTDNEINRLFALKKIELEEKTYNELYKLSSYYKTFEEHKEIILSKETIIRKSLELLDELEEKFVFLTAELKALSVYLENRLKQQ